MIDSMREEEKKKHKRNKNRKLETVAEKISGIWWNLFKFQRKYHICLNKSNKKSVFSPIVIIGMSLKEGKKKHKRKHCEKRCQGLVKPCQGKN